MDSSALDISPGRTQNDSDWSDLQLMTILEPPALGLVLSLPGSEGRVHHNFPGVKDALEVNQWGKGETADKVC